MTELLLNSGVKRQSTAGVFTVLSVSANGDCASLERIFKSGCTMIASATLASAFSVLREVAVPIVICDCDTAPGAWGQMLQHISLLPDPPLFIVTCRLADDYLWAEALNLGAWDVLAKPFDIEEVTRSVNSAWRHWQDRHGIHSRRTAQRKAATGT